MNLYVYLVVHTEAKLQQTVRLYAFLLLRYNPLATGRAPSISSDHP